MVFIWIVALKTIICILLLNRVDCYSTNLGNQSHNKKPAEAGITDNSVSLKATVRINLYLNWCNSYRCIYDNSFIQRSQ